MKKCLIIYSLDIPSLKRFFSENIEKINNLIKSIDIKSIDSLIIKNSINIDDILKEIDKSDVVIADLSNMDSAVLFLLGYSISKNKSITTFIYGNNPDNIRLRRELTCLRGLYEPPIIYSRTKDYFGFFYKIRQPGNFESFLNKKIHQNSTFTGKDKKAFLYIKSNVNNPITRKVSTVIKQRNLPFTIDDPSENSILSMAWYQDHIFEIVGVIIELSTLPNSLHNLKCMFVAGLAYGSNKLLLNLSENFKVNMIHFENLLINIDDIESVPKIIDNFLNNITPIYIEFIKKDSNPNRSKVEHKKNIYINSELGSIFIGEHSAENEDNVAEYYYDKWNINNLTSVRNNIIIGRKGVGKTATLKAINALYSDKKNIHVCVINPLEGEMKELNHLMEDFVDREKNHIVQGIWKSLIFSQLIRSLYSELESCKPLAACSRQEIIFLDYVEDKKNYFLNDISITLASLSEMLSSNIFDRKQLRSEITEVLHENIISESKQVLSEYLRETNIEKIIILVDNLDLAWDNQVDSYDMQRLWMTGLIKTSNSFSRDLSRIQISYQQNLDVNFTIFLRSDIYYYVQKKLSEPDKLNVFNLNWKSSEELVSLINTRLCTLNKNSNLGFFWERFIIDKIQDLSTKDFIFNNILPRPRDLIYFLKSAQVSALRKFHSSINQEDILVALEDYSKWILSFMERESEAHIKNIKYFVDFMISIGETRIVDRNKIIESALKYEIISDKKEVDSLIDHLVSISVLGVETTDNQYEFIYTFDNLRPLKSFAERINSDKYKIHNCLLPYLRTQEEIPKFEESEIILNIKFLLEKMSSLLSLGQTINFSLTLILIMLIAVSAFTTNENLIDKLFNTEDQKERITE